MSKISLAIEGEQRDAVAGILEQVAKDGLDHPRDLDAAIDAIGYALEGEAVQKVDDLGAEYWLDGEDDAEAAFGGGVVVTRGIFIPLEEE